MTYKFLQNHFYSSIDSKKCELNKEATLFVKHWMDSNRHKELFKTVSLKVQNELNIQSIISSYELSNAIECSTYEVCEQFVISKLRDLIVSSKINEKEYENYFNKREHKFWYEKYASIYNVSSDFYFAENKEIIEDKNSLEKIYNKLAEPFNIFEEIDLKKFNL